MRIQSCYELKMRINWIRNQHIMKWDYWCSASRFVSTSRCSF